MGTLYSNFQWGFTGEPQQMLIEADRVVWRRNASPLSTSEIEAHNPIDLGGRWLMPSFIDEHCHILPTGLDLQKLHLGRCETHEQVLELLLTEVSKVPPGRWLLAVHYDQTRYPQGEHLTRYDLDRVSSEIPILLRHVSGHASVANTAALKAAGIRDDEPDFPGGTFRRDASGAIDGVLLEHAHERVTERAPKPSRDEMVSAILLAGQKMAELGISCASDMMTGRFDLPTELEAYRLASEAGCPIRLRLYMQWGAVFGGRAIDPHRLDDLKGAMNPLRCRVAGIKIFADGAIGSGTAAIYGPYAVPDTEHPTPNTSGSLMYRPERLNEMIRIAHEADYSIAIHSIGDYATDLVMDGLAATGEPARHRIEHAMILSDAQIERLARLGCQVTMQPEFLIRFGHAYLRQLGPDKRSHLKRARSLLDAGVPLSFSSDRPIVAGDPRDGIAVLTRRPEGYDPAENISAKEAWEGYTMSAAAANGDANLMGALDPGQIADYQVLRSKPL